MSSLQLTVLASLALILHKEAAFTLLTRPAVFIEESALAQSFQILDFLVD